MLSSRGGLGVECLLHKKDDSAPVDQSPLGAWYRAWQHFFIFVDFIKSVKTNYKNFTPNAVLIPSMSGIGVKICGSDFYGIIKLNPQLRNSARLRITLHLSKLRKSLHLAIIMRVPLYEVRCRILQNSV